DEERDRHLRALDARHLFQDNMTRLAVRRSAFLRDYVYEFIQTFASPLRRDVVDAARHQAAESTSATLTTAWPRAAGAGIHAGARPACEVLLPR
ncbi:hypothetical protein Q6296_26940, partial [Klebsiella variicola]|nr:hypothetical protein [Klebsiella variicola]